MVDCVDVFNTDDKRFKSSPKERKIEDWECFIHKSFFIHIGEIEQQNCEVERLWELPNSFYLIHFQNASGRIYQSISSPLPFPLSSPSIIQGGLVSHLDGMLNSSYSLGLITVER